MTEIELNAWYTANNYGWTFKNPKCFQNQLGIEVSEIYDGVIMYQCPDCKHVWKRFDWVSDEILKKYSQN